VLPPGDCFPQAKAAAARALEIDDSLGEAHNALATVQLLNELAWDAAGRAYRRALELSPSSVVTLHAFAFYLVMTDRADEAVRLASRAVELDPLSNTTPQHLAFVLFNARRYDESLAQLERAFAIDAEFPYSHATRSWNYRLQGREAAAVAAAEAGLALPAVEQDAYSKATMGWVLATSGRDDSARQTLAEVESLAAKRWVDPSWLGLLHEGLGDRDRALEFLILAREAGAPSVTYWGACPLFDSLREDGRFARLLRETRA
jgi:tetratricopeptide (TPR) repeat protein